MARNPLTNLIDSIVMWTPILAAVIAMGWVLVIGMMHLEMISYGTEFFVGNNETTNMPSWRTHVPEPGSPSSKAGSLDVDSLMDAVNSGDPARMQSALSQYENGGLR